MKTHPAATQLTRPRPSRCGSWLPRLFFGVLALALPLAAVAADHKSPPAKSSAAKATAAKATAVKAPAVKATVTKAAAAKAQAGEATDSVKGAKGAKGDSGTHAAAATASASAAASSPAPAGAQAAAPTPEAAVTLIQNLAKQLDEITQRAKNLDALHGEIGRQLDGVVDHDEMARRALPAAVWNARSQKERAEYTALLRKMFDRSYIQRFRPGKRVQIEVDAAPRPGKEGRLQVRTRLTIDRTRSQVGYSLHPVGGAWKLYDVVVDDTSQLSTWRKSFQRIIDAEGWQGLISRLQRGVDK